MKQYKLRKLSVGTVKKSMAAICFAWLARNVFHVCDRDAPPLTRYFATVDSARLKPRRRSSDWIRGVPQRGFSRDTLLISSRISLSIFGRPTGAFDFHRQ